MAGQLTSIHTPSEQSAAQATAPSIPLTREQIRTLQLMHCQFAEKLMPLFSELLPGSTLVLASISEITADQLDDMLPATDYRFTLSTGHPQAGLLACSNTLAMLIIAQQLGASDDTSRRLSVIEMQLLSQTLESMTASYTALWNSTFSSRLAMTAGSTEPTEPCFTVTYEVRTPDGHGTLTLVLFLSAWRELLASICPPARLASKANPHLLKVLGNCAVPVRVLFGRTTLTVDELLSLNAGDVLCLDRPADAPVEVSINNRPRLLGKAHLQNEHYVVTVTDGMPGGNLQ